MTVCLSLNCTFSEKVILIEAVGSEKGMLTRASRPAKTTYTQSNCHIVKISPSIVIDSASI
jgi:hypothetical protein